MRDYKLYLEDILESIKRIEKSVKNISKINFEKEIDIQDAILRRLEIIGEAVRSLPPNIKSKYSFVEWKEVIGFRDVITHSYFKTNLNIVWDIIENELPELKKQIQKIVSEENK